MARSEALARTGLCSCPRIRTEERHLPGTRRLIQDLGKERNARLHLSEFCFLTISQRRPEDDLVTKKKRKEKKIKISSPHPISLCALARLGTLAKPLMHLVTSVSALSGCQVGLACRCSRPVRIVGSHAVVTAAAQPGAPLWVAPDWWSGPRGWLGDWCGNLMLGRSCGPGVGHQRGILGRSRAV